ncbi:MAG: SDR family oxidoreductase [Clostridia bacterium]|nr:SDR family oxidoreductase [Clostridia bacterium]
MKNAVLITGAQTGTGYAIAETFAREGWAVFITSRRGDAAKEAAKKLAADYGVIADGFECRIGSEEKVKEMFLEIDRYDVELKTIVLNAANMGFYPEDPGAGQDFWTVPVEDFRGVFETNLVWNFTLIRQAAMRMRETGGGSVVFVSSNTAYRAIPNRTAYCASKGGINAMARALAVDLGPFGIRCNAVLPGTIKTERWKEMGSKQIVNGELTPIGDISEFQDIANACYFFGTDLSRNVTGTELVLDGGMSCQLYPRKLNEWKKKAMESES